MVPPPILQLLSESAPSLDLVLTPELHIVAVSEAYLRASMTERQKIRSISTGGRISACYPS